MPDRLTGMQVFERVAALGSLTAAARALSMSQTMATKHLAALESRLGVQLVHRSTRALRLTEAGRGYLDAVERILADIDEAEGRAAELRGTVRGTLRLNAPVSFGIRRLAPLLPGLAARHPDLVVDLGLNDRRVNLIDEGWDMAIRVGRLDDSRLVARKLADCPAVTCAAPAYLARHGTPRRVDELAGHVCLSYTLSRQAGGETWAFGARADIRVAVRGPVRANNGDVLVAAAVAGMGIVHQPDFLVEDEIAAGRLVPLVLDQPAPPIGGVHALWPADRSPPAKVRAVVDYLAGVMGP